MADPTFRAASSNVDIGGAATSLGVGNPTGLTDGDGQYLWATGFTVGGGSPVLSAPSGWTQYGSTITGALGAVDLSIALYWRIASSDGTATYTSDRAAFMAAVRCAYQFPHPAEWPSGITITTGTTASGTSHDATGITTTRRRQLTTWLIVGSTGSTWTPPGTVTERADLAGGISFAVGDAIEDAIGATGSRTFTSSVTLESRWAVAAFNGAPRPNGISRLGVC